ncbi:alpha-amylase family glycosyl hydrolase [Piscinibacter gummiphilus]|uniref:Alpha-glucosidase n=1 Tax=Piscinibacter gummiphilus TaxID=946333 RepID=A0A1W6L4V0_9BURK|nr:alpha-amylase family glycosyl hydrolase [Piscinibacter gummiphilus]ARN19190.1 alpha-glucosidase [Piscinibacter gummiphilus]ATU63851.1 alpha-glucosidase [Piscinibacter gummiphilus]GLS93203.1 alpha-glucosidase [Piscinibacter gummiphilus]
MNTSTSRLAPAADTHWWRGAVIYQVYPRSFADHNGDGVGDIAGIIDRLPYIASLGVDAIWVSPFFKSPMKDFGYDIADYRDVDPLFGTLADMDRLIARTHELGLKLMIDQVLSHTSDQHEWFKESRSSRTNAKADWYVWADPKADGTPPNNWLSVFGGSAWQWDSRRRQFYLHNFLSSQPDLNFHNPEVQDQILADIRFWLERGVDGFRFDACIFHFHDRQLRDNPPAEKRDTRSVGESNPYGMQRHLYDKTQPENLPFLQRIRTLLNEYGAASVGEIGDDDSLRIMAEYTRGGDKLHMAYSFNLLTSDNTAGHIRNEVEELEAQMHDGWASWSYGNHDVPRVLTRWGGPGASTDYSKVAMAMLVSLRGSVCWWQGDELGLTEADIPFEKLQDPYGITFWPDFKGRDGCRTPMPWVQAQPHAGFSRGLDVAPWLPVPAEHATRAVDVNEAKPDSPLNFMRRLLAWRHTQPALVTGDIRFVDAPEPVLVLVRSPEHGGDGATLLCVFNLGADPVDLTLAVPDSLAVATHLDPALQGQREGQRFTLPGHGFYFGEIAA